MLDAHRDLAIPPETHFVLQVADVCSRASDPATAFLGTLQQHFSWPDFHLHVDAIRTRIFEAGPFDVSEALRAFYFSYAGRFGKSRWGDKTPTYLSQMTGIEALLPESRFIHVIRDGRDVSLSIADLWFGPHPGRKTAEEVALWWATKVREGRQDGSKLRHYMEVRYEDLVIHTERTLRAVGVFLDLPWDPAMLEYHQNAGQRISELDTSSEAPDGRALSPETRQQIHELTASPPAAERIGRWRTEMSADDQQQFLRAAAGLLADLGYE